MLTAISTYAGELLKPWDAIELSNKNISLLHKGSIDQIEVPTEEEKKEYENQKERYEEENYSEEVIEAKGMFDYDDGDINQYHNRLIRAIKYTEMICKSLPAFHSKLKLNQKNELVNSIYLYPRKIAYAILRPIDIQLDDICEEILQYTNENSLKKKNGKEYTKDDILESFYDLARATMLSLFDHFAEIATNMKSIDLLMSKEINDISEHLERLLVIESIGNTDLLVKEAEKLLKIYKGTEYDIMVKLIVRKHLLTNNDLSFGKKHQVVDKIFGKGARKYFLTNHE